MNIESIVVLITVSVLVGGLGLAIFLKGILINRAEKKDDKKIKEEPKNTEEKVEPPSENILPVGIIKNENVNNEQKLPVEDFAPLREKHSSTNTTNKEKQDKTIAQQIKDLSPEMKAILFSDVIKPKF